MNLHYVIFIIIVAILFLILVKKTNAKEHFMLRPQKPLNFIHITKTAGTSIENLAKKSGIKWGRFNKEYCSNFSIGRYNYDRWHNYFPYLDKDVRNKYDWFMVVRNPYDRVVSEFNWWVRGFMADFYTKKNFNEYIRKRIKNIRKSGGHFSPQYMYLTSDDIIHVVKFENITEEFNGLMNEYNIDIKLENKDNASNYHFTIKDLDAETIKLIQKVYKKDFELFGYDINIVH